MFYGHLTNKRVIRIGISMILVFPVYFISCIEKDPEQVTNIVKDFNLGWRGDSTNRALYVNNDHTEYGGIKIVEATVLGIGWNQEFIVVIQNPNQEESSATDSIFHIIDIQDYDLRFWGPGDNLYTFESSEAFRKKQLELGVPNLEIRSADKID